MLDNVVGFQWDEGNTDKNLESQTLRIGSVNKYFSMNLY